MDLTGVSSLFSRGFVGRAKRRTRSQMLAVKRERAARAYIRMVKKRQREAAARERRLDAVRRAEIKHQNCKTKARICAERCRAQWVRCHSRVK